MKKAQSFARILSKVLEVLYWLGAAAMVGVLVCALTIRDRFGAALFLLNGELSVCGFEITVSDGGTANPTAIALFAAAGILLLSLMAMVFRNVYLILKTTQGQTWFSEGGTPFQSHVVRMLRETGIFLMAGPMVGLVMSTAARLVLGVDAVELSLRLDGFMLGLLVLCLSQMFAYGQTLQSEVDGLL